MNYRNACNSLSSAVTFKKPSFFFSHPSIFVKSLLLPPHPKMRAAESPLMALLAQVFC